MAVQTEFSIEPDRAGLKRVALICQNAKGILRPASSGFHQVAGRSGLNPKKGEQRVGKGHYHGGGTLVGPKGEPSAKPSTSSRGSSAATIEARHQARKTEAAAQKRKADANQKLIMKLARQWQEEKGRAHFAKLTEQREEPLGKVLKRVGEDATPNQSVIALALQKAVAKKAD